MINSSTHRELVKGSAVDAAAVMKVLVAPSADVAPQGNHGRKGFTWTTPGELVTLASSGDCFAGLESRKCTSKAVVAEVEMTDAESPPACRSGRAPGP